ncbi:MAG: amidohydrolase [Porticoccaceae bacterium]|nr:MAG: amidohydrolase [Porticoccaceae bacterium]
MVGEIDRAWLDRVVPHRPVRLQHRGGRLWVVNSAALRALGLPCAGQPAGVEMAEGAPTGRLYDCDHWLAARLESRPPSLAAVSRRLAAYGVTGVTDATPANDLQSWRHFAAEQARGHLLQRVRLMGGEELAQVSATPTLAPGEFKIHLLESRLPPFAELCAQVAAAHETGRAVAIHCVTAVELAFALGALAEVGARRGDRIEHAAVAPPPLAARIAELGLRVVSQPQLVAERGDRYLAEVEAADRLWLWRLAGLRAAGISLAGGSDAPFGSPDPWAAMRAAVARRTAAGLRLGPAEALSPEEALELFLHPLDAPGCGVRRVAVGAPADLVLLALPWARLRLDLDARHVRAVWRDGSPIHGGFG